MLMPNDLSSQGPFGKNPNGNGNGNGPIVPPSTSPTSPTTQSDVPAPGPTQIAGVEVIKNPHQQTANVASDTHTLRRWKCAKCGTIIESFHEITSCSKCGAGPESLIDSD